MILKVVVFLHFLSVQASQTNEDPADISSQIIRLHTREMPLESSSSAEEVGGPTQETSAPTPVADGAFSAGCTETDAVSNASQIASAISTLGERFFDTPACHLELKRLREVVLSLKDNEKELILLNELEEKISRWIIVRRYIDPLIYLVIISVGLVGNITLLIIFAHHNRVRTAPNLVILNIAIADVVSLVFVAPMYHIGEYLGAASIPGGCSFPTFVRVTLLGVSGFSIATLSTQRLLATKVVEQQGSLQHLVTTSPSFVRLVILTIWLVSLLISTPLFFAFEFTDGTCFPLILTTSLYRAMLVCYIVLFVTLPLPIVGLSIVTVYRLRRRAAVFARTAKIISILATFYFLLYIPRACWYGYVSWLRINRREAPFIYIDEVLSFLHFLEPCVNPIVLYMSSKTFKSLFAGYLCFWQKPTRLFMAKKQKNLVSCENWSKSTP